MKTIVCANGKGGVGKTTIAALLVEWCNHIGVPVGLLDTDPNNTAQAYANYSLEEGRDLLSPSPELRIVDTAGTSGSAIKQLQGADLIAVPFKPNFADTDLMVSWFLSLNSALQDKFAFIPNMRGRAKEQRLGVEEIAEVVEEVGRGRLLAPGLKARTAIYPDVLRGGPTNFFELGRRWKAAQEEAEAVCRALLEAAEVTP